jgi:NADH:ubiquinone oxidoreductase subunit F (NADH-binding)/NADH:ubiquinone oxidoreductase subunit E
MIVQELRQIQERCGYLPDHELRALSQRLQVPLHRLHEVASFYPLYRFKPPPPVDVKVCRDMACHLRGAARLQQSLEAFGHEFGDNQVEVAGVSCLGQCDRPVAVSINDHYIYRGYPEAQLRNHIERAVNRDHLFPQKSDYSSLGWKIDPYAPHLRHGEGPDKGGLRYDAVRELAREMRENPGAEARKRHGDEILAKMEAAKLKGMGGAGFPTFRKWSAVRGAPGAEKFVVCNADESEPGTFKDRELMRRTPYLLLEGMILAGLITGATRGFVYIRHEFPDEIAVMEEALRQARAENLCGDNVLGTGVSFPIEVFVSPGGYVQGEESALLEAIEDRRGEPRNKPPFPVFNGLFNKPTVINNVETLCWVPAILKRGGEWYRDQGTNGATGLRFVSICGDVVRPGVYEVPFGQTVRQLVMETAGGIPGGRKLKAIAPSGPSGGFLPLEPKLANLPEAFVKARVPAGATKYNILDLPLDSATLGQIGSMLGAAFVAYDETRDMVENALNCTEFFRNESCGKCVPCRVGSQKLVDLIGEVLARKSNPSKLTLVSELSDTMLLTSICGLGQVASNPIASVLRHFREDVEKYVAKNGR